MNKIIIIPLSVFLAGCASASLTHDQETILGALNTQADGYSFKGKTTGDIYEIVSTSVNDARLCRVVSSKGADRFIVETYCKEKGGQWR